MNYTTLLRGAILWSFTSLWPIFVLSTCAQWPSDHNFNTTILKRKPYPNLREQYRMLCLKHTYIWIANKYDHFKRDYCYIPSDHVTIFTIFLPNRDKNVLFWGYIVFKSDFQCFAITIMVYTGCYYIWVDTKSHSKFNVQTPYFHFSIIFRPRANKMLNSKGYIMNAILILVYLYTQYDKVWAWKYLWGSLYFTG